MGAAISKQKVIYRAQACCKQLQHYLRDNWSTITVYHRLPSLSLSLSLSLSQIPSSFLIENIIIQLRMIAAHMQIQFEFFKTSTHTRICICMCLNFQASRSMFATCDCSPAKHGDGYRILIRHNINTMIW